MKWPWVVDPDAQTFEVRERAKGRWSWLSRWGDEADARIPPFEGIAIPLHRMWV